MAQGDREIEIKLAVPDAAGARRLLRAAGFRVHRARVFESNTVFDTAERKMLASSSLVRVRQAGRRVTLTYKGPPVPSRHKEREEIELDLETTGARALALILDRLGFAPVFRYEKYRTEFRRPGQRGIATLDETPIGFYMELEGGPRWIDRTAKALGFAEADYITTSYGSLYREWCRTRRLKPRDMVFG
jgi:adenylate cyclase, class 2